MLGTVLACVPITVALLLLSVYSQVLEERVNDGASDPHDDLHDRA